MEPATGPSRPGAGRQCAAVAAAAALLVLACQWLSVRYNYQGNWTALFLTGSKIGVPPGKEFAGTYVHARSYGYDGQFYRLIAHDPAFRRGLARHIDNPRLRCQRILVPGLAYTVALGRAGWIDGAYVTVILGFVLLGTYWTARWVAAHGWPAAWGLVFLTLPATMVSATRMTVDVALAALACAWALYATRGELSPKAYAVLAALPLAREAGLLFNLASAAQACFERRVRRAAAVALTVIPAALWFAFLTRHTQPDPTNWLVRLPLAGLVRSLASGPHEGAGGLIRVALIALHYAALAGVLLGIALAVRMWLARPRGSFEVAALAFALLAIQLGNSDIWSEVIGFGRVFSPLLLLLALAALARRKMLLAAPLALTLPRMLAELVSPALGVVRGMLG
ncbi:MAG: hypothetical protein ABSD56_08715 [Bryobacteraceae bacterium]